MKAKEYVCPSAVDDGDLFEFKFVASGKGIEFWRDDCDGLGSQSKHTMSWDAVPDAVRWIMEAWHEFNLEQFNRMK